MAHNDWTPWALDGILTPDKKTDGANRVSGVYYEDVSLLLGHTGGCLFECDPDCILNSECNACPAYECGGCAVQSECIIGCVVAGDCEEIRVNTDTSFYLGFTNIYCDLEVLSVADGRFNEIDEPEVDGVENSRSFQQTTLFDDGGMGAVCHTHAGYYVNSEWNTPGCYYDPTFGEDATSERVWITTVCDYGHPARVGVAGYLFACANHYDRGGWPEYGQCGADLLGCFPTSPTGCLSDDNLLGCANASCLLSIRGCLTYLSAAARTACPLGTGLECGADAYGTGGFQTAGITGWSNDGVALQIVPYPCEEMDGATSVFVWTAVFVDWTGSAPIYDLSVPTVGVIY